MAGGADENDPAVANQHVADSPGCAGAIDDERLVDNQVDADLLRSGEGPAGDEQGDCDHTKGHSAQYRIGREPMRVFSTDHKVIGLQYAFTSLAFLLIGFLLILALRWHLAGPTEALPLVGK